VKQKGEYGITQLSQQDAQAQLNKLGNNGWELVSIESTVNHGPTTYSLKRPK